MSEHGGYEVGYGKPPKGSQFQKGKSGNSSRRPKQDPGIAAVFRKVSKQKVTANGPSGQQCMTKLEAKETRSRMRWYPGWTHGPVSEGAFRAALSSLMCLRHAAITLRRSSCCTISNRRHLPRATVMPLTARFAVLWEDTIGREPIMRLLSRITVSH
jgi:hypothetical protein